MVKLRACFANHKVARYNRVTPPSIRMRQDEEATRTAAAAATITIPDQPSASARNSSLDSTTTPRQTLSSDIPPTPSPTHDATPSDENAFVAMENDASDVESAPSQKSTLMLDAALFDYDFDIMEGTAHATGLFKSNYYMSLWYEDLDKDVPQWQYDLEIRREAGDESCLECVPVAVANAAYIAMVTPVTMEYDVERMTRLRLRKCIDSLLGPRNAWTYSLTIGVSDDFWPTLVLLYVLTDAVPDFLVNLTIPLLSDNTLWLLGFSSFAKDLLQYKSAPNLLKSLVLAVQALAPEADGTLTPRLHF
ncbi:unnamed protein product [Peronospora destructor]|nr:unnamed protein product [Peronospora destructor]